MVNLTLRSVKKELLDRDDIPFEDIRQNMKELNTVNTLLGGHKVTLEGIRKILASSPHRNRLSICEIGCGGGDNMAAIDQWCRKKNINTTFIGIDHKKECTDFARMRYPELNAKWIESDYAKVDLSNDKPDIIFSSLFCHHFSDVELLTMLPWMRSNSRIGFLINDLHRSVLAYYSITWITSLFSRSYLVKNDAPLSVARGFKKQDWINLLKSANILDYTIRWKWAFRYLIVCINGS